MSELRATPCILHSVGDGAWVGELSKRAQERQERKLKYIDYLGVKPKDQCLKQRACGWQTHVYLNSWVKLFHPQSWSSFKIDQFGVQAETEYVLIKVTFQIEKGVVKLAQSKNYTLPHHA